jgi:hypothetical protein
MLPTKFQFIWESSFRVEDFLESNQSETRMACGGHVVLYKDCLFHPNLDTNMAATDNSCFCLVDI